VETTCSCQCQEGVEKGAARRLEPRSIGSLGKRCRGVTRARIIIYQKRRTNDGKEKQDSVKGEGNFTTYLGGSRRTGKEGYSEVLEGETLKRTDMGESKGENYCGG